MAPMPEGGRADAPPPEPQLQDEPDLVALVRLYPHAKSAEELRSLALAAGQAVREAGMKLRASQQEPVAPLPE